MLYRLVVYHSDLTYYLLFKSYKNTIIIVVIFESECLTSKVMVERRLQVVEVRMLDRIMNVYIKEGIKIASVTEKLRSNVMD